MLVFIEAKFLPFLSRFSNVFVGFVGPKEGRNAVDYYRFNLVIWE